MNPQPSAIDTELETLAAARGLNLASAKVSGERLYFVRRGEALLLDGQSLTRRELGGFFETGGHR